MIGLLLQRDEIQMCGVSATGVKGHSSSHMWVYYVLHTPRSLIISNSKIVADAKTSQEIGRNLTVPLLTIV